MIALSAGQCKVRISGFLRRQAVRSSSAALVRSGCAGFELNLKLVRAKSTQQWKPDISRYLV